MNNQEKYDQVFMAVFNAQAQDLGENFAFKAVKAWDSMAHMALVSSLEDAFDIMLDTEDILNITSYQNGKTALSKYQILI